MGFFTATTCAGASALRSVCKPVHLGSHVVLQLACQPLHSRKCARSQSDACTRYTWAVRAHASAQCMSLRICTAATQRRLDLTSFCGADRHHFLLFADIVARRLSPIHVGSLCSIAEPVFRMEL